MYALLSSSELESADLALAWELQNAYDKERDEGRDAVYAFTLQAEDELPVGWGAPPALLCGAKADVPAGAMWAGHDGELYACCPHCGGVVLIAELNCRVFTHQVSDSGEQVNPHATEAAAEDARQRAPWGGCARQFRVEGVAGGQMVPGEAVPGMRVVPCAGL